MGGRRRAGAGPVPGQEVGGRVPKSNSWAGRSQERGRGGGEGPIAPRTGTGSSRGPSPSPTGALAGACPRWGMPKALQLPSPSGAGAASPESLPSQRGERGWGRLRSRSRMGVVVRSLPGMPASWHTPRPPAPWLVSDFKMLFASLRPTWETGR